MAYAGNNTGGPFAGVNTAAFTKFVESNYRWTDPPRWFKANDPYWYQLDNLPLKQIHENCKWLKDQIEFTLQASGVGRSDFNELRPYGVGSDRKVRVLPGNFIGRVNDAYNKGLATYEIQNEDRYRSFIYEAANARIAVTPELYEVTLRDQVFATLIGYDITPSSSFPANGLFDSLQHHQIMNYHGEDLLDPYKDHVYAAKAGARVDQYTTSILGGLQNMPKVKLALWQGTATNYLSPHSDLQQRSVDFTRRWGAVTRTAVVNSPQIVTIDIPDFNDADFPSNSNYIPQVRIDLVFMYTHPIDSKETTILESDGNAPTKITEPKLGLVKGAGIITTKNQGTAYTDAQADIQAVPSLTDTVDWKTIKDSKDLWYTAGDQTQFNPGDGAYEMRSLIADQRQALAGFKDRNLFGSFPSPDDLLNLSPYLQLDLEDNEYSLLGQSILPIAYVVVKKGASVITEEDIIDIRPFFRTAELAYNERSGIAAANPPLSLANPAVGRKELQEVLNTYSTAVRDLVYDVSASIPQGPGGGSFSDPETSSLGAAFAYGTVTYGPGEWTWTRKYNGTNTNFNYRISQDVPPASAAVFASVRGKLTQTYTSHSTDDPNLQYGFKLIFMNNEGVLVETRDGPTGTFGRNYNNKSYFLEIPPTSVPLDADKIQVKVYYGGAGAGQPEGGDSIHGSVEVYLSINYGTFTAANVIAGTGIAS